MIREKKFEVRVTLDEYKDIKNLSESMNITISELIRQSVRANVYVDDKRKMAQHICKLQSHMNMIYQVGATTDNIKSVGKEVNSLWQCLR